MEYFNSIQEQLFPIRFELLYSIIELDVNGYFGHQQFLSHLINVSYEFLVYIFTHFCAIYEQSMEKLSAF